MPDLPPLTPAMLQDYADTQAEVEAGLDQDCAAIEEILVRLAGPTLQGIEDDTRHLAELQERLASAPLEGIKRDMQRITRMLRKLFTPVDQGISQDTTLLTGIAARAQGSTFPANRGSPPHSRVRPNSPQVGTGTANPVTRPTTPPNRPPRVGLSSPASTGTPSATPGYTGRGPSPIPSLPSIPPAGGNTGAQFGSTEDLSGLAAQEQAAIPPTPADLSPAGQFAAEGVTPSPINVPGQYTVTPTPTGAGAPSMPAPIAGVSTNGRVGSASPVPSLPPLAPVPTAPTPPLPEAPAPIPPPPAPGCDLCEVAQYLGEILHSGLGAIANALALLTPGAQRQYETALEDTVDEDSQPQLLWTAPPGQAITEQDADGIWDWAWRIMQEQAAAQQRYPPIGRPAESQFPRTAAPLEEA